MILAIGLSHIAVTMLMYIPSIPSFLKSFYHEVVLDFIKDFSASIEMIKCFLSLLL
jgi:hypothetical protein